MFDGLDGGLGEPVAAGVVGGGGFELNTIVTAKKSKRITKLWTSVGADDACPAENVEPVDQL